MRILVDTYYDENSGLFSQKTLKKDFSAYVNYILGLEKDDLDLEFLPTDETERELRISALRTEIMAGAGPDVFLLGCNVPGWEKNRKNEGWEDKDAAEALGNSTRLFPDVQAAMRNRLFLPLDKYIENAQWLDTSLLHSVVSEAGRTEEGQVVLPITFTFPYAVYSTKGLEEPEKVSIGWNEDNGWARSAYGDLVCGQFSSLFEELADYDREKLLFSEEELLETVQNALRRERESPAGEAVLYTDNLSHQEMAFWRPGYYDFNADYYTTSEDVQALASIPNISGGVTADITAYVCINRSTKRPEDAFKIVDFLFYDQVQSGNGDMNLDYTKAYQTWILANCYGIPARNDLLQDNRLSFAMWYLAEWSINPRFREALFEEYTALRQEVTSARFYGPLDEELQTMFEACMEAGSDEEVEEIVSKAYITMQMLLAES